MASLTTTTSSPVALPAASTTAPASSVSPAANKRPHLAGDDAPWRAAATGSAVISCAAPAVPRTRQDPRRRPRGHALRPPVRPLPVEEIQSKTISGRSWTGVGDLDEFTEGRSVLIRGAAQAIRPVSKKMAFFVLRQSISTVQCVLIASADAGVSTQLVHFTTSLSKESIVDVEGVVSLPKEPLKATTQQAEIQVRKIYCINRAIPTLPINLEDAARSEAEFQKAEQKFREFLLSNNFVGIHSPKLIAGSSEGGAAVFNLQYNGQPACLAQSPQLYKQMAICGGFKRVFEVGPVFRAENSNTHRHLCEFVGLDAEMEIKEHYFEVCDIIDGLFIAIFKHMNESCKKELETINRPCTIFISI